MKLVLTFLFLLNASPVLSLSCKNDYAGGTGCAANSTAAGDCETLGYSKTAEMGCAHYLLCPFDSTYRRCVKGTASETCPKRFSDSYPTVESCGIGGAENYIFASTTLSNGTICGQCILKTCQQRGFNIFIGNQDDGEFSQNYDDACPYGSICAYCSEGPGDHDMIHYAKITGCEEGFKYYANARSPANRCLSQCKVGDRLYEMWDSWQGTQKYVCSAEKPKRNGYMEIGVVANYNYNSGIVMSKGTKLASLSSAGAACKINGRANGIQNTAALQALKESGACTNSSPARAAATVSKFSWPSQGSYINLSPWYIPAIDEIALAGKPGNSGSWSSEQASDFIFKAFFSGVGEMFCSSTEYYYLQGDHYDGGIQNYTNLAMGCVPIKFAKFVLPMYESM